MPSLVDEVNRRLYPPRCKQLRRRRSREGAKRTINAGRGRSPKGPTENRIKGERALMSAQRAVDKGADGARREEIAAERRSVKQR